MNIIEEETTTSKHDLVEEIRKAQGEYADPDEPEFSLQKGLWVFNGIQLWVSLNDLLRRKLINEFYDSLTAGHFERDKPLLALKRLLYWKGMDVDVDDHDDSLSKKPSKAKTSATPGATRAKASNKDAEFPATPLPTQPKSTKKKTVVTPPPSQDATPKKKFTTQAKATQRKKQLLRSAAFSPKEMKLLRSAGTSSKGKFSEKRLRRASRALSKIAGLLARLKLSKPKPKAQKAPETQETKPEHEHEQTVEDQGSSGEEGDI
ncbi:hypothetical protein EG329_008334 [Mollisiaceae sp. DMI_Dod_QoI]|nr:hypothetical protein EG329_008334 [Helotiales sp. DMI_Dod_QoI]